MRSVILLALLLPQALAGEAPAPVDFTRDVRPILASKCFTCHGPDAKARKANLRLDGRDDALADLGGYAAIVPGDLEASELIYRIRDGDDPMPPAKSGLTLTPAEVAILERWVAEGAPYADHWGFAPPERPEPPPAVGDWARNEVDAFVHARLRTAGLRPTPEADRRTLIRRLSLDLTGLPPKPAEVSRFLEDAAPDAYERLVERLLASPHYGERWASPWLDIARYADTKGYEADRGRTMWPYRDWVVDALNADMPFDEFTALQLAGDLLPGATDRDRLATAFHRNTMTNDEGGTDDEEFRVAAVVDRTNTTMLAWMGMSMACAQCHDHKYDPISQKEYFQLYAFFNTTTDADRMDEAPVLEIRTEEDDALLAQLREELLAAEAAVEEVLEANGGPVEVVDEGPADTAMPRDVVWIDEVVPAGAAPEDSDSGSWPWRQEGVKAPQAFRGEWVTDSLAKKRDAFRQHFFDGALRPLVVEEGDVLFAHVWLDPAAPPRTVMVQLKVGGSWEHRAFWGGDHIGFGATGTGSRRPMGELPATGEWVRLEMSLEDVGLAPGDAVHGWAFSQNGGRVCWDAAGVHTSGAKAIAKPWTFADWVAARGGEVEPEELDFLREAHTPTRILLRREEAYVTEVGARLKAVESRASRVPVMVEQATEDRRTTHVLGRGSFLSPEEEVSAGTPEVFHPWPADVEPNRLSLARWLTDRANPLTARVQANRIWQEIFGVGLVRTSEDFGIQGELPSHPHLLDWLAVELMDRGWSQKELLRQIVTSATYRQASTVTAHALEVDPDNRLLSRSPRTQLTGEMVRDQALVASGLLDPTLGGPPVYPPQPDGVWQVVYNGASWPNAREGLHRRALYTYWRRTSPYPSMITFDAPSRELCTVRRVPTRTPLQSLVLLNDPVYLEAAGALAQRMLEAGDDRAALGHGFERVLCRLPEAWELERLEQLLAAEREHWRAVPEDAATYLASCRAPAPADHAPELAAFTAVASVLLNLDETMTRP